MVALSGVGGFVMALAFFGAEALRLTIDTQSVQRELEARSTGIRPVLDARTAALDNAEIVRRFKDIDPFPSQIALMANIAQVLPKNETHLTEWNWDHGQLEIVVAANHPLDTLYFVRSIEHLPGFKGVTAEQISGDNALRIRANVDPKW